MIEHHQKALELWEQLAKEFPSEPVFRDHVGHSQRSLCTLHSAPATWSQAESHCRRAIEAFEANVGIGDEKQISTRAMFLADTRCILGSVLLHQKKHAEAEEMLLKGYRDLKEQEPTLPPWIKARLPHTADRLIALCRATGKKDELAHWQAERAKYPAAKAPSKDKK